jgi:hypothetical protein
VQDATAVDQQLVRADPVSSTFIARFFSISLKRRSRKWRLVTYSPSLPKNGEVLMVKSMLIVGSSTLT